MPSGQHSKASRDLCNIMSQLRSGKTRCGRVLSDQEIEERQEKEVNLRTEIEDLRGVRVNGHSTQESNRVIHAAKEATANSETFFSAVGTAGSSTNVLAQAQVMMVRAKAQQKEKEYYEK